MSDPYEPDLEVGRRFLAANPPRGEVLLCAVTGAHLYGFASADSDLDLKGVHAAPTESLLGLGAPAEAHDVTAVLDGVECDLTTNELKPALELVLRGNGNLLERLFSRWQLVVTPALEELRELARGALSKRLYHHYRGFFRGTCRQHEREPAARAKPLLYAYRVALTGVHLLRSGEVVADLGELAPRYGFEAALELIEHKRSGGEAVALDSAQDKRHRAAWGALETALAAALAASELPDAPPNRAAIESWLIARRRQGLG